MIPSSVTGVLAFLASVGPGYVYVRIRENWTPYVERTSLREGAQIVVAGSLATVVGVVVTLVAGLIQAFTAEQTPVDERELTLVRSGASAMQVRSPNGAIAELPEDFIVLRGSEILYVAATFVPIPPAPAPDPA